MSVLDAILAGADVPVLVQGATGRTAGRHLAAMRGHGTRIVAGVSPRRPETPDPDLPVFTDCAAAVRATGAVASVVMVPPLAAGAAAEEAIRAGIGLLVIVTEGVPAHDTARAVALARAHGAMLIGPTTPGLAVPGRFKLGFMPEAALRPGPLAVLARSGTLSYEVCHRLAGRGLGQSLWVGAGGDAIKGTWFADFAAPLAAHAATRALVVVGEIGGRDEEGLAAALGACGFAKPVFALLAGGRAPEGVTLGHAGALIHGGRGTVATKRAALEAAGARVFTRIRDLVDAVAGAIGTGTERGPRSCSR